MKLEEKKIVQDNKFERTIHLSSIYYVSIESAQRVLVSHLTWLIKYDEPVQGRTLVIAGDVLDLVINPTANAMADRYIFCKNLHLL